MLKSVYLCTMDAPTTNSDTVSGLNGVPDVYRGITVDTRDLHFSQTEFEGNLKASLSEWIRNDMRGVWVRVNIENSTYIPVLVKHGFQFHHAKASYAMLTRWLPEDEPNLLPQFPHTHIGVGGMVINDKNQILVIQEKYHKKRHWKLPGGYSNPGEDFADTARREVLEETGVDTEFVSVVSLRHHHQHIFACSDIYVVCLLRPLTSEITSNKEEIAQCQWMDVETYRKHPDVTDFNHFVMEAYLESRHLKATVISSPVLSYTKDSQQRSYTKVYTVKPIEDKS